MKKSPVQEVRERFGSKEALAKLLLDKLERPYEDETDEEFARRIRTASNKKLLRLHATQERLDKEFEGSKSGLVDAIMALVTQGNEDAQYREKLESLHVTRLFDLHEMHTRQAKKN